MVRRGKMNIVGMDGVVADEEFYQFNYAEQEEENMDDGPYITKGMELCYLG
jgi:hypothetical protein